MQARCPRCGAELTADAAVCPVCAYGEVEDIVIVEATVPGVPRPESERSGRPSSRIFVLVAFLVVVLVAIFVALD
ncbi:MAG TPA: zinc-ribbon domain-containing protein [Acidimicrobiia bacterium]|nr:zinc-ribbon domain-containing protein [Acidimicrobiia bacterium]